MSIVCLYKVLFALPSALRLIVKMNICRFGLDRGNGSPDERGYLGVFTLCVNPQSDLEDGYLAGDFTGEKLRETLEPPRTTAFACDSISEAPIIVVARNP